MRLLKLGIYDPAYLRASYARRPALAEASYDVQHAALIEDRVASSDFWTAALRRIGYATADIVANAEPLQRRWALENGVSDVAQVGFAIAAAQVRQFAPDILLVADYSTFTPAFLGGLRAACPSIKRIAGWCGAPFRDLAVMREWDLALSCVPELVARFRAAGIQAHHVAHGFDPRVLDQLKPAAGTPGFSFVGSVIKSAGFHQHREALLVRLLQDTPLELWSTAGSGGRGWLRTTARRILGAPAPIHPLIARRAHPALYGVAMFQKLRDSEVTLNTHIDASTDSASNMRLFEATGVGTCLLTDWKSDLATLFEPDTEVVTYASADEAIEKYRFLAEHPRERGGVAAAGQRRTLRDHTIDHRAARLDAIFRTSLATGR